MTTDIDLPEPVDGIVSEIHGTLPLFQKSLVSILDARAPLLEAGRLDYSSAGDNVGRCWRLLLTAHRLSVEAWNTEYGFDFSAARSKAANQWRSLRLKPADLSWSRDVGPRWTMNVYISLNISGQPRGRSTTGHRPRASASGSTPRRPLAPAFRTRRPRQEHIFAQGFFGWPEATVLVRRRRGPR